MRHVFAEGARQGTYPTSKDIVTMIKAIGRSNAVWKSDYPFCTSFSKSVCGPVAM